MDGLNYAGFWIRLGARLLDALVMLPIALLCQWLLKTIGIAWIIPYGFVMFIYFPYFHAMSGQTPGKRLTGLRVTRLEGSPVGWSRALSRCLIDCLAITAWGVALFVAIENLPVPPAQLD